VGPVANTGEGEQHVFILHPPPGQEILRRMR